MGRRPPPCAEGPCINRLTTPAPVHRDAINRRLPHHTVRGKRGASSGGDEWSPAQHRRKGPLPIDNEPFQKSWHETPCTPQLSTLCVGGRHPLSLREGGARGRYCHHPFFFSPQLLRFIQLMTRAHTRHRPSLLYKQCGASFSCCLWLFCAAAPLPPGLVRIFLVEGLMV